MYNEKRKREYLRYKEDTTELANNIYTLFDNASFFEDKYGKDVCDWTSAEIIGFCKYLSTPKIKTLTVNVNALRMYTDWCLSNSLVGDGQNHWYEITSDVLIECVDKVRLAESYLTYEDLMEKLPRCKNASDKFIILGLFEGLTIGEISEIRPQDYDNGELVLPSRRLPISEELQNIFAEASIETEYAVYGDKHRYYQAQTDTPQLIKRVLNNPPENLRIVIGSRYRTASQAVGISANVTPTNMRESGRMDFIRRQMAQTGLSLHEALLKENRAEMERRYGKVQNYMVYEKLYGSIINK